MADYYCSSAAHTAVPQWAASTVYSVGQFVRQLAAPAAGNERVFRCTTAGTSGASEPAWNLGNNATTTTGTATFTQVGGQAAHFWSAAIPRMSILNTLFALADQDRIFVSQDHSETSAAIYTIPGAASGILSILCVNRAGSTPPVAADLTTGAVIETTGNNNINVPARSTYMYGVTLRAGQGATGTASITFGGFNTARYIMDNCDFRLASTGTGSRIFIGDTSTSPGVTEWTNCRARFGATAQGITIGFGDFYWKDQGGALAVDNAGSIPTILFTTVTTNGNSGSILCEGLDLSNVNTQIFNQNGSNRGTRRLTNCRLNSATVTVSDSDSVVGNELNYWGADNCDDSTNNRAIRSVRRYGAMLSETDLSVRAGTGADDGNGNQYSMRVRSASASGPVDVMQPGRSSSFSRWNNSTGAAINVSVECIYNSAAAWTDVDAWLELSTLESSSHPLQTKRTSRNSATNIITTTGTNIPASTRAWDTTASRANSTSYAQYAIVKVASNPGRLFVKTNSGSHTSAASEPAAFATAVDGDSITDNTVTWRCMRRGKFDITFTPQRRGLITGLIKFTRRTADDILFVDPFIRVV